MNPVTPDLAGGILWLIDLMPVAAGLLALLVLFEGAILLGMIVATIEKPPRGARAPDPLAPADRRPDLTVTDGGDGGQAG